MKILEDVSGENTEDWLNLDIVNQQYSTEFMLPFSHCIEN